MSSAVVAGRRLDVPGKERLSVWLPDDWEVVEDQMYDLLALGPSEEPYRANLSIAHITLDAGPTSLEEVARATATVQSNTLETFLEYDRRETELVGRPAIQREYAWVQGATGLVLYQLEVLAQTVTRGASSKCMPPARRQPTSATLRCCGA